MIVSSQKAGKCGLDSDLSWIDQTFSALFTLACFQELSRVESEHLHFIPFGWAYDSFWRESLGNRVPVSKRNTFLLLAGSEKCYSSPKISEIADMIQSFRFSGLLTESLLSTDEVTVKTIHPNADACAIVTATYDDPKFRQLLGLTSMHSVMAEIEDEIELENLLDDAVMLLCPRNSISIDTQMIYTALSHGTIPVVVRSSAFRAFSQNNIGDFLPFPQLMDWNELPILIKLLKSDPSLSQKIQQNCVIWWKSYMHSMQDYFADMIETYLSDQDLTID